MSSLGFTEGADGDSIQYAAHASINTLSQWTALFWIRYGAMASNFRSLLMKQADGGDADVQRVISFFGATKEYVLRLGRGTGGTATRANYVGGGTLDLSGTVWSYVAVTYDFDGADSEDFKLYEGDLTTSAVRFPHASWDTSDDGSGAIGNEDAFDLHIMNYSTTKSTAVGGDLAFFGHWDRVLDIEEIREQQFDQHKTDNCQILSFPGYNALVNVPNLAGNADVLLGTLFSGGDDVYTLENGCPAVKPFGRDRQWAGAFAAAGDPAAEMAWYVPERQPAHAEPEVVAYG